MLDDPRDISSSNRSRTTPTFVARSAATRSATRRRLRGVIRELTGVAVDPSALFDVQIKRIHEYKRQLLNILETVALYQAIRAEPDADWAPRVKIFAGKAAASYVRAKLIIKLANDVGRVINADPVVGDRLKMAFLPNYNVSSRRTIIPAADLSEQISTAGMEASGTGNMKLALNGALTIGTLDGANVEIREQVGGDNIFIFGLTADEVEAAPAGGVSPAARPSTVAAAAARRRRHRGGTVLARRPGAVSAARRRAARLRPFHGGGGFRRLLAGAARDRCAVAQPAAWWRASILNTARMGWFSSDRAIREYADEIWRDADELADTCTMKNQCDALFIGQTYIDVTFLTDHIPVGDEKSVASEYAVSFGGNAVTAAFCCAKLGDQARPDRDRRGRLARPHVPRHGGEVRRSAASIRKVEKSSLSFIMPNDGKRAIVRCRDDRLSRRRFRCSI